MRLELGVTHYSFLSFREMAKPELRSKDREYDNYFNGHLGIEALDLILTFFMIIMVIIASCSKAMFFS